MNRDPLIDLMGLIVNGWDVDFTTENDKFVASCKQRVFELRKGREYTYVKRIVAEAGDIDEVITSLARKVDDFNAN